jgi:hypothetical protein
MLLRSACLGGLQLVWAGSAARERVQNDDRDHRDRAAADQQEGQTD